MLSFLDKKGEVLSVEKDLKPISYKEAVLELLRILKTHGSIMVRVVGESSELMVYVKVGKKFVLLSFIDVPPKKSLVEKAVLSKTEFIKRTFLTRDVQDFSDEDYEAFLSFFIIQLCGQRVSFWGEISL